MTGPPGPAVRRLLVAAALIGTSVGCTQSPVSGQTPATTTGLLVAPAVADAVRTSIIRFNATANGPVANQRALLGALVDPGQDAVQRACPGATSTLAVEPAWADLAPSPGWAPIRGSLVGPAYSLPALVRVYRGGRLIGSDVADLHFTVAAGTARFAALCVS